MHTLVQVKKPRHTMHACIHFSSLTKTKINIFSALSSLFSPLPLLLLARCLSFSILVFRRAIRWADPMASSTMPSRQVPLMTPNVKTPHVERALDTGFTCAVPSSLCRGLPSLLSTVTSLDSHTLFSHSSPCMHSRLCWGYSLVLRLAYDTEAATMTD
jgi:hypothetical protein